MIATIQQHPKSMFAAVALAAAIAASMPVAARAQQIIVQVGPPPMVQEVMPGPRPGWVWVQGHQEWRHNHHVWVPGYWVRERAGYGWVQPRWEQRGGQWVYFAGNWQRHDHGHHRGGPNGDRDHDGVPNRYDRRPNDPYRR